MGFGLGERETESNLKNRVERRNCGGSEVVAHALGYIQVGV